MIWCGGFIANILHALIVAHNAIFISFMHHGNT